MTTDLGMKLGALIMPSHPPERPVRAGQCWDINEIQRLDRLGFSEAWVGEHFTAPWEPCPAPDLLIAQALSVTKNIVLGPLGHLLPYHHPVELAHRVAYLDHLAEGRYQLGVGISALATDHDIFGLDARGGRNRRMTFEALELMTTLWSTGGQNFSGEFWTIRQPERGPVDLRFHLRPHQKPHPPIAIAGMTPGSQNHQLAGEKGYLPVSFVISPDAAVTAGHWNSVLAGAARSGRIPDRRQWRVIRDIYVAPTDAEARSLAVNGIMGRCWREFLLPLYLASGLGPLLKHHPSVPDEALDVEYLAEHLWLTGCPETVAAEINQLQCATGGFGYLLTTCYDATEEEREWERSLDLLANEVLPRCGLPTALAIGRDR